MRRRAFTLVEILITLVIIGALGGMMYLAFGGSDESAKRTACLGEMEKIKTQYSINKFASGGDFKKTMEGIFGNISQVDDDTVGIDTATCKGLCRDNGTYTIKKGSTSVLVSCSIHGGYLVDTASGGGASGGGGGESGGGDYIPGTTVPPNYRWATQEDMERDLAANPNLTIVNGTSLMIGDKYYVYNGTDFTPDTESNNPFDSNDWISPEQNNPALIKLPDSNDPVPEWSTLSGTIDKGTVVALTKDGVTRFFVRTYTGITGAWDEPASSGSWLELHSN